MKRRQHTLLLHRVNLHLQRARVFFYTVQFGISSAPGNLNVDLNGQRIVTNDEVFSTLECVIDRISQKGQDIHIGYPQRVEVTRTSNCVLTEGAAIDIFDGCMVCKV